MTLKDLRKYLFKGFHQLLFIVIISNALHCGQCLASVSLLDPYVDFILCPGREQVVTLSCISKGIYRKK